MIEIELGCGWGCWINNTGLAARRSGLNVHMIGVEADQGHISFAREAASTNGFSTEQITLLHGIAAARAGVALFPNQASAGNSWGLEPIFDAPPDAQAQLTSTGNYISIPMISLHELTASATRVDLLHIDIQGGEADFISASLSLLQDKVAYLVIGTHSRQIEGRIFSALLDTGWRLEIERPAIFAIKDEGLITTMDGVQGWRNMSLSPP